MSDFWELMFQVQDLLRLGSLMWSSDLLLFGERSYDYPSVDCKHKGIGEGNGTPLQYSCLENPMDGGAW